MRARFAPSPTGLMHLGNCRTACFNYLLTRKTRGSFVLRIEDTDRNRSAKEYVTQLCEDLKRLGLDWDEGPQRAGAYAPYYQSQRKNVYADYYSRLEEQGRAYPCFCSEAGLKMMRKRQLAAGEPPRYSGICRSLTKEEIAARRKAREKAALRMKVADDAVFSFTDLVRGTQVFHGRHLGDFVIRKNDGEPSFMFANAVDDALMKIDCVLRGEDHLANTPRQILILEALDLPRPQYGHISILLGNDGLPLSKRNGSRHIGELLDKGYLPIALLNYLARLGCSYAKDDLLEKDQLIADFDIHRLVGAAARYEERQLKFWQKCAVKKMMAEEMWNWLSPMIKDEIPTKSRYTFAAVIKDNILFAEEALFWAQTIFAPWDIEKGVDEKGRIFIKEAGSDFFRIAVLQLREINGELDWQAYIERLGRKTAKQGKQLFMPLRLALTGKNSGPALDQLLRLLGTEETIRRLSLASSLATS